MDLEFIFNQMVDPHERFSVVRACTCMPPSYCKQEGACRWIGSSVFSWQGTCRWAALGSGGAQGQGGGSPGRPAGAAPWAAVCACPPCPCACAPPQTVTLGVAARPQMAWACSSTAYAFHKLHVQDEAGEGVLRPFVIETKFDGGW